MNRQAIVGLFTILGLIGLFGIFLVLANVGTQGRYKIGVHFKTAAGLHKGALVYESGVVVGVVDSTQLLPDDFTVDVILAINNNVDVPRDARFVIQAPLTGDSTVEILPHLPPARPSAGPTNAPRAVAVLPHEVLPLSQQPQGVNPTTVQDLLDQGQGEIRRLDAMLAQLERTEPVLLGQLQAILKNGNQLTATANQSAQKLSRRIDTIGDTLQLAIQQGSANLTDVTGQLDKTVRGNRGHFDSMVAALDRSAHDLNDTADHIKSLAGDPRLHDNILQATHGLAETATQFSAVASDLHDITGNPQTKAQLRDTVANIDAAAQKANSIFGQFGGSSSVYGVDSGATPAPAPVPGGASPQPQAPGTAYPQPAPRSGGASPPPTRAANLNSRVNQLVKGLVQLQLRVSELDNQRAGSINTGSIPTNRGPSTDLNLVLFPHGNQSLFAGFNDIGGPSPTSNFALMMRMAPGLQLGGGILYSQLGARALYTPGRSGHGLGFEGMIYNPRYPTADAYVNYRLNEALMLFGGERDLLHAGRRTTFGLQYNF
jgi:ABC-type transporter Mla subunit MlaD